MGEGRKARDALLMLRGMDRADARKSVANMVMMERLGSPKGARPPFAINVVMLRSRSDNVNKVNQVRTGHSGPRRLKY
jgi:hypothetical protein